MSLLKRISFFVIGIMLAGTAAEAAVSTIWGAPHASVVATNRIPVDASALSGPGYNSVGDILNLINGDCTVNINSGQITCTKANGVSFSGVATSGSASDITSGTLAAARLPNPSASALGGIQSFSQQGQKWIDSISVSGVPHASQPQDADLLVTDTVGNNVTTSAHGFAPKLPNDAAKYLDGTGHYTSPSAFTTIDFSGDGVVLSNTPSAGPHMAATLATATANSLLGNTTGSTATPTYTTSPVVSGAMTANTLVSTVATGTAPITVTSTTPVTNLSIGGNAATATVLATTRAIGGVNFDGSAAITPQQILPASEAADTTNFPLFINTASGTAQQPKYNASFGYNSSTNAITATTFIGALTGNASTATTAGTLTTALSANQVLGSLTAVAPTGQSVPSCSTTGSALIWTNGTGFGCNSTIVASSATSATNTTNTAITDDTNTNATMDLTWVTSNTGNLPQKTTSTKLTFNPSTGVLSSTSFTGAGTGLTGTAASLTAGNVTTNANLTGPITSVGNAVASIAAHGAVMGNGTGAVNTIAPGTSGNVLTSNGTDWTSSAASGSSSLKYNAQSTTYAPVAGDLAKLVDFTGSSNTTFTMTSAATLGNGWFCYIRNNGTSNAQLTLASSSGTIDGVATTGYIMYAGEIRLILSDGTNFTTQVVNGGSAVFTSSGSWQRPPGYTSFQVEIISGGSPGADRTTTGNASGGGGGGYFGDIFPASRLVAVGSTETVTVAATSAGVTGNSAGAGNNSGFTINGATITVNGGLGGGTAASASPAASAASGIPSGITATANFFWPIGGSATAALSGIYGAEGGAVTSGNVPGVGGNSIHGGGGGGGCSSTAGGTRSGGSSILAGAGGAGCASGGASGGTNGTAPGGGGGGGAGGTSGSGGAGQVTVRGIL